ncbi:MAG: hypothetical protein M1831_000258 [Alyxoria varia]|nr:MAG: hypothetical protein M1831_000258 [Alyxoria varia]
MPPRAPAEVWHIILSHLTLFDVAAIRMTCHDLAVIGKEHLNREREIRERYRLLTEDSIGPYHEDVCNYFNQALQGKPSEMKTVNEFLHQTSKYCFPSLGALLGLVIRNENARSYAETLHLVSDLSQRGQGPGNEFQAKGLAMMIAKDRQDVCRIGHSRGYQPSSGWKRNREYFFRVLLDRYQVFSPNRTPGMSTFLDLKHDPRGHAWLDPESADFTKAVMNGHMDALFTLLLMLLPRLKRLELAQSQVCSSGVAPVWSTTLCSRIGWGRERALGSLQELKFHTTRYSELFCNHFGFLLALPSLRLLELQSDGLAHSFMYQSEKYGDLDKVAPGDHKTPWLSRVGDVRFCRTNMNREAVSRFVRYRFEGPCILRQAGSGRQRFKLPAPLDDAPYQLDWNILVIPGRRQRNGELLCLEEWEKQWTFHLYFADPYGAIRKVEVSKAESDGRIWYSSMCGKKSSATAPTMQTLLSIDPRNEV